MKKVSLLMDFAILTFRQLCSLPWVAMAPIWDFGFGILIMWYAVQILSRFITYCRFFMF